jgi:hypothetical protein
MSIVERINPDNINIHQFQETPEGRPELPFDVERDISTKVKENIVDYVYKNRHGSLYPWLAKNIAILWPAEKGLITQSAEESWQPIERTVVSSDFVADLYSLKLIYPDFNPPISMEDWNRLNLSIKDYLEDERKKTDNPLSILATINWYKAINPESEFKLTTEEVNKLKNLLTPDLIVKYHYTEPAAQLKLLDPSFTPQLSPANWAQLHEQLAFYESTEEWHLYAEQAVSMKILAAHKVEVTASGVIDIQMYPPDINESTPSIPETRKF